MNKTIINITKTIILALLLNSASTTATAQQTKLTHYNRCMEHVKFGLNVLKYVNGNGHGGYYNFGLALNSHRHTISAGIGMQKSTQKFNGAGMTYTYTLVGRNTSCNQDDEQYNDREELKLFCTVNYYNHAGLSNATINAEGKMTNEVMNTYKNIRLNTVEAFAGIGYDHWLGNNFKLKSFIGIGYYNHLNYDYPTYHEKSAVVLMTGIGFSFMK